MAADLLINYYTNELPRHVRLSSSSHRLRLRKRRRRSWSDVVVLLFIPFPSSISEIIWCGRLLGVRLFARSAALLCFGSSPSTLPSSCACYPPMISGPCFFHCFLSHLLPCNQAGKRSAPSPTALSSLLGRGEARDGACGGLLVAGIPNKLVLVYGAFRVPVCVGVRSPCHTHTRQDKPTSLTPLTPFLPHGAVRTSRRNSRRSSPRIASNRGALACSPSGCSV